MSMETMEMSFLTNDKEERYDDPNPDLGASAVPLRSAGQNRESSSTESVLEKSFSRRGTQD